MENMSNSTLAKILRGLCATLILGISFPIAGQAQMHRGPHLDGGRSDRAHFGTARAGYYGGVHRIGLERHRVKSHHGAGPAWHEGFYRRGVAAASADWRQSFWPYWGWDMAASVLATDPPYYSYYYGFGYGDKIPTDADAVAYCVQRFRSYDRASSTYLGSDGHRHVCP